jgi:hypothetical protein
MAVRCPLAAHVNDIQTDVKKDDLKILDETMGSEMGVKTEDLEEGPEEVEVMTTCEKQINVNYQFELNGIEVIRWRKGCSALLILIPRNQKLVAVMTSRSTTAAAAT